MNHLAWGCTLAFAALVAILAGGCQSKAAAPPRETAQGQEERQTVTAAALPPTESVDAAAPDEPQSVSTHPDPPKTRGPTEPVKAPAKAIPITFDDINLGMQADVVFREWMLNDRAKELIDQRVQLVGYIDASGLSQRRNIKQLVLLRNTECKFGPGGQADHLVNVLFQGDASASYTDKPVEIEGVLRFNPYQGPDGNTWCVFDLEADRIGPPTRRTALSAAKENEQSGRRQ